MENKNTLAKISLVINALLVIAVIMLFVKMPSSSSADAEAEQDSTMVSIDQSEPVNIAYYNSDSLNEKSDFVTDILKEIENANLNAQNKIKNQELKIQNWQKKWSDMGTLLPAEQEQAMAEGQKLEQEYGMLQQQVQMEVAKKQEEMMLTLYTRIRKYGKSFSEKNDIDLLISYQLGQSVTYCNPRLDVTKEFINHVNVEYKKTSSNDASDEAEDEKEQD